jgi:enoyl-[acyl-carrier protein] reductase II
MALGADGVQVGTRFAVSVESSAHENYKQAVVRARDGDTVLTLKQLTPTRLIKTPFALRALEAERKGAGPDELRDLMGEKRERAGIFEGNTEEGAIEAGQSSGLIREVLPAARIVWNMMEQYYEAKRSMP